MQSDLQAFWQSQPAEHSVLGLEEARELQREHSPLGGRYYLYAFFCFVFCAVNLFLAEPSLLDRVGGVFWFVCGLGLIHRGHQMGKAIGPRRIATDLVFKSCLEAYRKEIEAERYAPLGWTFVALALLLGALSLVPGSDDVAGAWLWAGPLVILLGVWILMMLGWPRYFADLRREMDQLRAVEGE